MYTRSASPVRRSRGVRGASTQYGAQVCGECMRCWASPLQMRSATSGGGGGGAGGGEEGCTSFHSSSYSRCSECRGGGAPGAAPADGGNCGRAGCGCDCGGCEGGCERCSGCGCGCGGCGGGGGGTLARSEAAPAKGRLTRSADSAADSAAESAAESAADSAAESPPAAAAAAAGAGAGALAGAGAGA